MENDSLKNAMKKGLFWKFGEKVFVQGTQLLLQIILARLLFPDDFGVLAILNVFIALSDVFILYSFTTALIQKKNADQLDFSSVFFFNIGISILLYLILFFCAPLVSKFYKIESLTVLLRVLALNIIIGSFSSIQNAIVSKSLRFKITFIKSIALVITYAVVSIVLAVNGFGVWSLVLGKVASTVVGTGILIILVKWVPTKEFSFHRMKSLFSFSSKILGTNLLGTVFQNMSSLVIGKYYTTEDLGYYNKGQQLPQAAMSAIDGSLSEVLYPSMSIIQSDEKALKQLLGRALCLVYFIIAPIMIGGIVIAPRLIPALLTEKWVQSVPFFQLQCVVCMFWPMNSETHMLNAKGLSKLTFILSLTSNIISLLFILIGVRYSIYVIMIGAILGNLVAVSLSSVFAYKHVSYSIIDLAKDIGPSFVSALLMGACVYFISRVPLSDHYVLVLQIISGAVIYFVMSMVIHNKGLIYLKKYFTRKK